MTTNDLPARAHNIFGTPAPRDLKRSSDVTTTDHTPAAAGEQPPPIPSDRPSVQGMVRADLEERERVGIQRYGTPLQAHNGRDALVDAYQEALDLACYLRQMLAEREAPVVAASPGASGSTSGDVPRCGAQEEGFQPCHREAGHEGGHRSPPPPAVPPSPVILGRALASGGRVWLQDLADTGLWSAGDGVWLTRTEVESFGHGPVREVLLVSPATGRVLDAARELVGGLRLVEAIGKPLSGPGRALVDAYDAMVGDRPAEPAQCCDLHGRNCEPPSELCCEGCTEAQHPSHPPGVACTWARDADVAFAQAVQRLAGNAPEAESTEADIRRLRDCSRRWGDWDDLPTSTTTCPDCHWGRAAHPTAASVGDRPVLSSPGVVRVIRAAELLIAAGHKHDTAEIRELCAAVEEMHGGQASTPVAADLTPKPRGLYGKFHVRRVDGRDQPGGDKAGASYFVLDYVHDPHARVALAAYAEACAEGYPELAADLRALIPSSVAADLTGTEWKEQNPAKPVPAPDSGPGWDRSALEALLARSGADATDHELRQVVALLAWADHEHEWRKHWAQRFVVAERERDAVRAEVERLRIDYAESLRGRDENNEDTERACAAASRLRTELAEVTADRDRYGAWNNEARTLLAGRDAELVGARADVRRIRGELDRQAAALAAVTAQLDQARRDHPAVDLGRWTQDAQVAALEWATSRVVAAIARHGDALGTAGIVTCLNQWTAAVRSGVAEIRPASSGEVDARIVSTNIDSGRRVTRKPHRCAYCDDPIPAGTLTAWWKWADADVIVTSYGHDECIAADHWDAAESGRYDDEELTDPGDFVREVLPAYREHLRDSRPASSGEGRSDGDR